MRDVADIKPCRPEDRKMERYAVWMARRSEAFAGAAFRHFQVTNPGKKPEKP